MFDFKNNDWEPTSDLSSADLSIFSVALVSAPELDERDSAASFAMAEMCTDRGLFKVVAGVTT